MHLLGKLNVFIWFSFLYRTVYCGGEHYLENDLTAGGLSRGQQRQLYDEITSLSQQQRQLLFEDLQRQSQEFDISRDKWSRRRQTLPPTGDISPVSQADVDNIRKTIRSGSSPVIRNKRTLKFLVKSLAEILGLRWTLLKYSLIPGIVNGVIPPAPASPAAPAAPAAPAPPGKPGPPSGRLPPPSKPAPPPPRRPPPPPPPPPKSAPPAARPPPPPPAPAKPGAPAAPPAARPPPPTIPPNQIDPNTIRYPFRPAPTIPILNFAPLPPGVTVPYPPLFQWPSTAPSPAPAMPPQPPCAAPPPPKSPPMPPPKTPSILPLPKPRLPAPPRPRPAKPVLPASPGKGPVKLEYDTPVRIEIFNNVKPYLPASGNVYSGEPTLTSLEEKDETERYLNPTQAIQDIDQQYNTEPAQTYNQDYDYGFLTHTPKHLVLDDEVQTTPIKISDYDDDDRRSHYEHTEKTAEDYDTRNQNYEETTPDDRYSGFASNFDDYPEQAEENRAHVNVKVRNFRKSHSGENNKIPKKVRKTKRIKSPRNKIEGSESKGHWNRVFNHSTKSPWTVQSHPPSTISSPSKNENDRGQNRFTPKKRPSVITTTEFPNNHARQWKSVVSRPVKLQNESQFKTKKIPKLSENPQKPHNEEAKSQKINSVSRHFNSFTEPQNKPSREFRIIVPNARRRRDIFFDDAFKSFNLSAFETFKASELPESTQAQFLEINGKLVPDLDYRKKLEKDVEKYVEKYVEQQISNGEVDIKKPKTTIIELKTNKGPPIKTITTTLSKIVDGDKPFLKSILDFSKEINPVSNIGEIGGILESEPTEPSEVSKAFQNEPVTFGDSFSWSLSS